MKNKTLSRQVFRRETFAACFDLVTNKNMKLVRVGGRVVRCIGMARRDRRNLARAYAAGEQRLQPIA